MRDYPQLWLTYGPSVEDDTDLAACFRAGATGVRLTFSYGSRELQRERAQQVKRIAREIGVHVATVADLQGEKNRFAKIGEIASIPVRVGQEIVVGDVVPVIDGERLHLPVQFPNLLVDVVQGDILVEGDGALLLKIVSVDPETRRVTCIPDADGVIHPGRGLVAQSETFHPRPLTDKDIADAEFIARESDFDAVAMSFVRDGSDLDVLRSLVPRHQLVAKVETPLGIRNIDNIVRAADFIMAARGDLALTMPWVQLPNAVAMIAESSLRAAKPWILATQIAEGLERFAFPTRAEICDLAHWLNAGAFGVMLSYETAFGSRPVDAVDAVAQVVRAFGKDHDSARRPLSLL